LAQSIKGIKGVIACSAGFQPQSNSIGFRFIGIAGTQDMNYLEVKQTHELLKKNKLPSSLIVFEGKHQWPPESALMEAIIMLEIETMKGVTSPQNKNTIDEYLNSVTLKTNTLKVSTDPDSLYLAYSILERSLPILKSSRNVNALESLQIEIKQNPIFQNHQTKIEEVEKQESAKQQEFIAAFEMKQNDWWKKEIDKLNITTDNIKGNASKRLLGFISLNCYGYVNGALQYKNWKAAEHFIYIYHLADPENPDCWYANACLLANTEKLDEAIASLNKAVEFGFANYTKLKADPLLNNLHKRLGFEKLVSR
jgi:hypothetical protein